MSKILLIVCVKTIKKIHTNFYLINKSLISIIKPEKNIKLISA